LTHLLTDVRLHGVKRLLALMDAWLSQATAVREAYEVAKALDHPRMIDRALRAYSEAIQNIAWAVHQLALSARERTLSGKRPPPRPPHIPFEVMERAWIVLRDEVEAAKALADRASHRHDRDAKRLRISADRLTEVVVEYAPFMAAEMKRRGLWTEALAHELGLLDWLE
jgi:hypothetical protein